MTPSGAGPYPPLPSLLISPLSLQSGGPTRPTQLHTLQVKGTLGPGWGGGQGVLGRPDRWPTRHSSIRVSFAIPSVAQSTDVAYTQAFLISFSE